MGINWNNVPTWDGGNNNNNGYSYNNNRYNNNGYNRNDGFNNGPLSGQGYNSNNNSNAWGDQNNNNNYNGYSNQNSGKNYNGFLVVDGWVDNRVINDLTQPDNISNNSGIRSSVNRMPSDNDLTNVTSKVLRNVTNHRLSEVKFVSNINNSPFVMNYKVYEDTTTHVRKVYIDYTTNVGNYGGPLSTNIIDLIQQDQAAGDSNTTNYAVAFSNITSATNLNAINSAQLYADAIRLAIDYVIDRISHEDCVRLNNGRWEMSQSLYDLLENGSIIYAGIKIKPILSINQYDGRPEVKLNLDFSENITMLFKGDLNYREGFKILTSL